MLILWFRKNKAFKPNTDEEKKNELTPDGEDTVNQFRLEHPDIAISNAKDMFTEDGNLLATIEEVKLWDNIQN